MSSSKLNTPRSTPPPLAHVCRMHYWSAKFSDKSSSGKNHTFDLNVGIQLTYIQTDMRLPGPQDRHRLHYPHDRHWRNPRHSLTRRDYQWHVLDDDRCAWRCRVWYVSPNAFPLPIIYLKTPPPRKILYTVYYLLTTIPGAGGEYPASSTAASEAANDLMPKRRGPAFIMVTNFPLSFGGPFAVSIFLIVLCACSETHYSTVWRVCFGIGCVWPLSIFYFRIRMLNSVLYRRGAIKKHVPYKLVLRYYWRSLIGTCGAWFLYGKNRTPYTYTSTLST